MATMTIKPEIHDRGRGPEIKGTRITVYDVLDYHKHGWSAARIAELFRLSEEQVALAIQYIEDHKEEVWRQYNKILARHAKGNPPEIQKKLEESHRRFQVRLEEWRLRKAEEQRAAETIGRSQL